MGQIKWLGHAGFEIIGEKRIFLDPFQIQTSDTADIILISHSHYDHLSKEDIKKIATPSTTIAVTPDSQSSLRDFPGKVVLVEPNNTYDIGGVKIHTVPSYNVNKHFHPQANDWVGYIIETEGKRIYHAGDTDLIPEMGSMPRFNIDVAMLPCSGTYVMTASECARAAESIRPKLVVPMHWGSIVGTIKDAEMVRDLLSGKIAVQIPEK
ncbi:MAG: metal dependent hydrolase [archaeon GW2011_AR3]|nr:MAG: metal dependent hydrolase [archaeon GW2011_AR3]MBS3109299.1 MBL fold metallo-hydrolase [Candidatus Woesearchaeota archaeon]